MRRPSKSFSLLGPYVQSDKLTIPFLILVVFCFFGGQAEGQTSIYVFSPDQSTVVKTGGLAGVHETYAITGQFRLTVDFDEGVVSFDNVQANLTDETGLVYGRSLNEIFNMTGVAGAIVDGTTIQFEGKTADGTESDVNLKLILSDDSAPLTGKTTPPPDSADMFFYDVNAVATKKYGGGSGEPDDPYLIYTAEQLNTIGLNKEDADKHFKLMADIDLSAYQGDSFNRIGYYPTDFDPSRHYSFTGVFDGNNHTISNFTYVVDVNEPPSWGYYGDTDVGLFGTVYGSQAQIKNLGLIDPNIYPAVTCSERVSYVGAIAGNLGYGSITNCYVEGGRVSADRSVGGLVGSVSHWGTISNCYTTCDVTLAKGRWLRPIEEPGTHSGSSFGGLVGSTRGHIYNCYATGRIQADSTVGGLVGYNGFEQYSDVVICDSYATGDVSGEKSVGGLVGENIDTIRRCCAFGSVSGSDTVGGLVGINNRFGNDQYVGIVTNCYAMSHTSGNNHIGGMAGVNTGMLITCYSAGEVSGASNVGGLVGTNQYLSKDGTAENCFWDIETSGQLKSKGGTWKTTELMQDSNTFLGAGWDFIGLHDGPHDIWSEPEGGGYPILWWQLPSNFGLSAFSGGTGEPNNPYLISTPDELNSIGHNPRLMGAHFKLNNDIDLAGVDFSIIGLSTLPFNGVFDGNNHLISNFTYNGNEEEHIGLFRIVKGENAQIKNIGLIDPNVTGVTGNRVGSLIGTLFEGTISDCYAKGDSVLGIEYVGGLVGMNEDGAVTDCYTTGPVSGQMYVGGLVGVNKDGTVTTCYATGPVNGHEYISGLVGGNWDGKVKNSYATGPVSGSIHVGGLVGMNWYGTVNACYSIGSVSGDSNIGGLMGNNDYNGSIISCFWDIEASELTNMCGTQGDDATGCDNTYGKTKTAMQIATTFLEAGWDFVDEEQNGTEDIWWILEGQGYPRLAWEPIPMTFITFDLNEDPNWIATGPWQFGKPVGQGGTEYGHPDPNSGYTGEHVYGVNLAGDFSIAQADWGPFYLTTNAIDCSNYHHIQVQFARWLNTDHATYIRTFVDVSNDSSNWHTVWEYSDTNAALTDDSWQIVTYDISAYANRQSMVYISWGYEILGQDAWIYSGWNIDDIKLLGVHPGGN